MDIKVIPVSSLVENNIPNLFQQEKNGKNFWWQIYPLQLIGHVACLLFAMASSLPERRARTTQIRRQYFVSINLQCNRPHY